MDRRPDSRVGAAAADIGDRRVDLGIGRLRLLLEEGGHRHDHPALAIAALRDVVSEPSLLYRVQAPIRRKALDCRDLAAFEGGGGDRAGPRRGPVYMHGAGAALSDAATVFGAGQAQSIAQDPKQRSVRIDIDLLRLSVDREAGHGTTPLSARGTWPGEQGASLGPPWTSPNPPFGVVSVTVR